MKSITTYIYEKLKIRRNSSDVHYIKDTDDLEQLIKKRFNEKTGYLDLSNISFTKATLVQGLSYKIFEALRNFIRGNDNLKSINVTNWDFGKVDMLNYLFGYAYHVEEIIGLETWDVSNIVSMTGLFDACPMLTELNGIEYWDVSKCKTFMGMFDNCARLKRLDFSNWILPDKISNISSMFARCFKLTEIKGLEKWDVSAVRSCESIFAGCKQLKELDLSNWKLQPRTSQRMFANCVNLETIGNVSNWDFSNNIDTSDMFVSCEKLELDMSMVPMNISVSKVRMFKDANKKIKKPKFK